MRGAMLARSIVMVCGVLIGGCSKPAVPDTAKGASDANIVSILAIANENEIEEARLAHDRVSDARVKAFASHMIQEHSVMLNQWQALSKDLMLVPTESERGQAMVREHQNTMELFKSKNGIDFDRAYLDHEVRMHQKTIAIIEEAQIQVDRILLKQFLDRAQPKLQDHLRLAQGIRTRE